MLKNVPPTVGLVISFGVLSVSQAYAQTKTCDLQLEVIQNPESGDAKEILIKDAEASFASRETKKVVEADLKERMPYFAKLPEGQYRLLVTKKGHKTTIKFVDLVCSLADERGAVSEIVFLSKGNSKQIVEMTKPKSSNAIKNDSQQMQSDTIPELAPKIVESGVLNGRALVLYRPEYPREAREVRASGVVQVRVLIDERGNVISAKAISGHKMLYQASERAALASKYTPTLLNGQPVQVSGIITFHFVP